MSEVTTNPNGYPEGYFVAQAHYCATASRINHTDFVDEIIHSTSIPRVLRRVSGTGDAPPEDMHAVITNLAAQIGEVDPDLYGKMIHAYYLAQPYAIHVDPKPDFGAFGYHLLDDKSTIQIHGSNPHRGSNPFSASMIEERRDDLRRLFNTAATNPAINKVIAGTWLFSIEMFRTIFPASLHYINPPVLSYNGDSMWGQFVNADGWENSRRIEVFRSGLRAAETQEQLLGALPLKVLFATSPLSVYLDEYA